MWGESFILSRNVEIESGECSGEASRYKVPFSTMGGRRKLFMEERLMFEI